MKDNTNDNNDFNDLLKDPSDYSSEDEIYFQNFINHILTDENNLKFKPSNGSGYVYKSNFDTVFNPDYNKPNFKDDFYNRFQALSSAEDDITNTNSNSDLVTKVKNEIPKQKEHGTSNLLKSSNISFGNYETIEKPSKNSKNLKAKEAQNKTNYNYDEKNIHKGHRKRLRETFEKVDPCTLPEHQILELLLSYAQPQRDVNPLAHRLLNEFGNFSAVLDASKQDLMKIKGIGETLASFIGFCSKLPSIYNFSKASTKKFLKTPEQMIDFVVNSVTVGTVETFYLVCLNAIGSVLTFKCLGTGSVNQIEINKRKIVEEVLKHATHSVIVCHTHPSGNFYPSENDTRFTNSLNSTLSGLNVHLRDHIIISPTGCYSFFTNKLLD